MQHPDEGTIHAWIDGALPAVEAAQVEAHVQTCAECAARVAEARGLVAASSRIVSALDVTPGGVIPAFGTRKPRRRWSTTWVNSAIAATLVIAAGTILTVKGRVVQSTRPAVTLRDSAAPVPQIAMPTAAPQEKTARPATATSPTRRETGVAAAPGRLGASVGAMAIRPTSAPSTDSVAAGAAAPDEKVAAAPAAPPPGRSAASSGGFAGASIGMQKAARPSVVMRRDVDRPDAVPVSAFTGCYELDESVDVLPRKFALTIAFDTVARRIAREVRYVDSAGAADGLIPDVRWSESAGRAEIRTNSRGNLLTIARDGDVVSVQSPLGPRTARVVACH